jgi:hypothetical protein
MGVGPYKNPFSENATWNQTYLNDHSYLESFDNA